MLHLATFVILTDDAEPRRAAAAVQNTWRDCVIFNIIYR